MIQAKTARALAISRAKLRSFEDELDALVKKHARRGEYHCYVSFQDNSLYASFWEELQKILVEQGYSVKQSNTTPRAPHHNLNYEISWI